MSDNADTKVKDIGSRPVGYTLSDESGLVDLRFDTEKDAQTVLDRMQKLVPPLMTSGKVVPIRGTIKERKGGAGRKPNAVRAAEAAQARGTVSAPESNRTPAPAGAKS